MGVGSNGGITIVQDPTTAQFNSMPISAIKFDHPDYILSSKDMPSLITDIASGKEDKADRKKTLSSYYPPEG